MLSPRLESGRDFRSAFEIPQKFPRIADCGPECALAFAVVGADLGCAAVALPAIPGEPGAFIEAQTGEQIIDAQSEQRRLIMRFEESEKFCCRAAVGPKQRFGGSHSGGSAEAFDFLFVGIENQFLANSIVH